MAPEQFYLLITFLGFIYSMLALVIVKRANKYFRIVNREPGKRYLSKNIRCGSDWDATTANVGAICLIFDRAYKGLDR